MTAFLTYLFFKHWGWLLECDSLLILLWSPWLLLFSCPLCPHFPAPNWWSAPEPVLFSVGVHSASFMVLSCTFMLTVSSFTFRAQTCSWTPEFCIQPPTLYYMLIYHLTQHSQNKLLVMPPKSTLSAFFFKSKQQLHSFSFSGQMALNSCCCFALSKRHTTH